MDDFRIISCCQFDSSLLQTSKGTVSVYGGEVSLVLVTAARSNAGSCRAGKRCCTPTPSTNRRLLSTLGQTTPQGWGRWRRGRRTTGTRRRRTRCQRSPTCPQVGIAHKALRSTGIFVSSFWMFFVLRETARAAEEGTRGGKTKVCPHRSPERKEAWPEEQQIRSQRFHPW